MNQSTIELYLYMGTTQPIIDWLKKEGVKTREQARQRLAPYVKSLVYSAVGVRGSSLAGASNGSTTILNAFPEE